MKVLHYNLGVPPYRSGGLTNWSMDLISWQVSQGIEVALLYPSEIKLFSKKIRIKSAGLFGQLPISRLVNPLPVPLIYDIDSADHYINYNKSVDFSDFFNAQKIDVIHLHTLMGLPFEFIKQAKAMGIRVIYTAHDIFGVWPEPDIDGSGADSIFNLGYVGRQKTLSYGSIILAQSLLYQKIKNNKIIKRIKARLGKQKTNKQSDALLVSDDSAPSASSLAKYELLRFNYKKYFEEIDRIHFNSPMIRDLFRLYGIERPNTVLPVYHSFMPAYPVKASRNDISRVRRPLRLLFNGTKEAYKGYALLIDVLDEIRQEGVDDFELYIYGTTEADREYINAKGSYSMDKLREVYKNIDLTIVPSLCYETFGMVVAESLSFGIPVVVSKNVGSKSLLKNRNYGFEFSSRIELKDYLKKIITEKEQILEQKSAIIRSKDLNFDSNNIYFKITEFYKKKDIR